MTNSGKIFADEITNWMMYESGFNQYKYQMSIYYKYTPYDSKLVVLYFVDYCGLVPAQNAPFALILWYVAKIIYLS